MLKFPVRSKFDFIYKIELLRERNKMNKKRLTAVLLAFALTLGGCGGDSSTTTSTPTSTSQSQVVNQDGGVDGSAGNYDDSGEVIPDAEQYMNYCLTSDPKVLDTTQTNTTTDLVVVANTVISLTRLQMFEGALTAMPYGAKSWDKSDDGMKYTFYLEEDAVWTDGVPVTAQQYVDAFQRILSPDVASPSATIINPIKNAEAVRLGEVDPSELGAKAIDDYTLEIELEYFVAYFMDLTYNPVFSPVRLDVIEQYGSSYGVEAENIIGCGAFTLDEWVHDSHLTLVKNPTYFQADDVLLEQINFKIIKDTNTIMAELYSGNVDRSSVSSVEWREKLIAADLHNYGDYVLGGTYMMILNTEYETNGVKIFSNEKIRQAISSAIDREQAVDFVANGLGIPAQGLIPSTISLDGSNYRELSGYVPMASHEAQDAKELFIEGLNELGVDPDPSKYSINFLVRSTSAADKDIAEYYYEVFKSTIGIKIDIQQVESAVGRDLTMAGDFGMTTVTYYSSTNDPNSLLSPWISSATGNYNHGWTSEAYDTAVATANSSADSSVRLENFMEAERLVVEEAALLIPIYHPMSSMMTAKYLYGFQSEASSFAPALFSTVFTSGR